MKHNRTYTTFTSGLKKLGIILLSACTAMGAYATLGDGNKKSDNPKTKILSSRTSSKPGSFTLKSGYNLSLINIESGIRARIQADHCPSLK